MTQGERHDLALFIDFENIALGLRGRADAHFDIQKVLQRLLEIGNVLVKRAYADWSRFGSYTKPFHEAAIELIEIPRRGDSGKNSADIRLCVDAMDLCYAKEHIDTFVIVSGDSDFSPLVSKLRENGKRVIGLGLRGSTSNLLVSNCDEFIFYETLDRHVAPQPAGPQDVRRDKDSLMKLVAQTVGALLREGRDPIQTSLVKDTIKRMQPSFNESDYGYRAFTEVLGDAQSRKLILMREDPRSGTYVITLPSGNAAANGHPPAPARDQGHGRHPAPQPAAAPVSTPAAVQPSLSEAASKPAPVPAPASAAPGAPATEKVPESTPAAAGPAPAPKRRGRSRRRTNAATTRRRAPSKGKAKGEKA